MRFNLVDRLLDFEPGKRIRMAKNLTLAEEYLADHFPTFPVMPGVLMLQTLVEAGAWLLRLTDDYRHSVIVLRGARNVKYGNFMQPGFSLVVSAEMAAASPEAPEVEFKGKGEMDGAATGSVTALSAKFTLARYNLRDRDPALEKVDKRIVDHLRALHLVLTGSVMSGSVAKGASCV